jgi:hypothetical protein
LEVRMQAAAVRELYESRPRFLSSKSRKLLSWRSFPVSGMHILMERYALNRCLSPSVSNGRTEGSLYTTFRGVMNFPTHDRILMIVPQT